MLGLLHSEPPSMSVTVMNVRIVEVPVRQHLMPVLMRMRLYTIPCEGMLVLMMLIVPV